MPRWSCPRLLFSAGVLAATAVPSLAQQSGEAPPVPPCRGVIMLADPGDVLQGPILQEDPPAAKIATPQPEECYRPLPINLATALRLADARPLVIAAAEAGVQIAVGQLKKASVLWLPNINIGVDYIRHGGGNQLINNGDLTTIDTNFFFAGGGLEFRFASTDAIFEPLAAKQVLRARNATVQTARNDALLDVATAYFGIQQARGTYAGMIDVVNRSRALVKRVDALGRGLAPPIEGDRARTQLADLEQAAASAQEDWRVSSATLTRVLRLDPAAVVAPLEPDHLQVLLVAPEQPVDHLIPIGLTMRPELAAHQALVQATLYRLKQEKLRPLIPSVLITGNGTPDFLYNYGIFGTGPGDRLDQWAGRADVSTQFVWRIENLGIGNLGRIQERKGQVQLAIVELFNVQDRVAAEVAQAHARLVSATIRVAQAEVGLKEAIITYEGNLKGMSETIRFGDVLQLVNRPQEVVAALSMLQQAYVNYFKTVADYNRAQFGLYHALGYPAQILACERPAGEIVPVDTDRKTPLLPPVCAPEPCSKSSHPYR